MDATAPLFAEVAEGPDGWQAVWLAADDGVRLRAAWSEGARGTVFVWQGRTECIEKYGRVARELTDAGFATVTHDWRGQGLADRLAADGMLGHAEDFADYQRDAEAVFALAGRLGLPRPWMVLAHSMGGCIALRSLMERRGGLARAVFSAPMWGIAGPPLLALLAPVIGLAARLTGRERKAYMPSTGPDCYLTTGEFADNTLTTDREHWDYMRRQVVAHPELGLGGPSIRWVRLAMAETRRLARLPSPDTPALCFLGSEEAVVDPQAIRARMARWPGGELVEVDGARHEILMEAPAIRAPVMARIVEFLTAGA
ncbi:MAG: alpha/beta hydrolase [Alphaproteobacteria bacterium]|nr:MAG: alpha/beta hydrolase [Alphaproteobacteria bacterium]